jgi:hypothetical protein
MRGRFGKLLLFGLLCCLGCSRKIPCPDPPDAPKFETASEQASNVQLGGKGIKRGSNGLVKKRKYSLLKRSGPKKNLLTSKPDQPGNASRSSSKGLLSSKPDKPGKVNRKTKAKPPGAPGVRKKKDSGKEPEKAKETE